MRMILEHFAGGAAHASMESQLLGEWQTHWQDARMTKAPGEAVGIPTLLIAIRAASGGKTNGSKRSYTFACVFCDTLCKNNLLDAIKRPRKMERTSPSGGLGVALRPK